MFAMEIPQPCTKSLISGCMSNQLTGCPCIIDSEADMFVQKRHNCSANALQLCLFCTNIWQAAAVSQLHYSAAEHRCFQCCRFRTKVGLPHWRKHTRRWVQTAGATAPSLLITNWSRNIPSSGHDRLIVHYIYHLLSGALGHCFMPQHHQHEYRTV